jgi:hypothetical protein
MLMDNISRITLVNSQANWKISSISSHAIRFPISLRRTLVNSILSKHHGITSFILYAGSNTVSGRRNPLPFSSSELDVTGSYMATKHAIGTIARHQDKVHV